MRRVDEREEVADRDGLHRLRTQGQHGAAHAVLVERDEDLAPGVEPLADAEPAAARSEERRDLRIHRQVVHARALHAAQLEHVLEALGGEDRGDRALVLEDGVGGDGGAVDEALDVGGPGAGER